MPRAPELSPEARDPTLVDVIDVIAGVLADGAGRVLIAQRPEGKHLAGGWEFPGGKLLDREAPLAGLKRELAEELGVTIRRAEPFVGLEHRYPDRLVRLDVWWVLDYAGDVRSCEGQALRWVDSAGLAAAPMLPADAPVVASVCRRLGGG